MVERSAWSGSDIPPVCFMSRHYRLLLACLQKLDTPMDAPSAFQLLQEVCLRRELETSYNLVTDSLPLSKISGAPPCGPGTFQIQHIQAQEIRRMILFLTGGVILAGLLAVGMARVAGRQPIAKKGEFVIEEPILARVEGETSCYPARRQGRG
jgi:hypothetical protein